MQVQVLRLIKPKSAAMTMALILPMMPVQAASTALWQLSEAPSEAAQTMSASSEAASWRKPARSHVQDLPEDLVFRLAINKQALSTHAGTQASAATTMQLPLPSGAALSLRPHWQDGQAGTRLVQGNTVRDFRLGTQHLSESASVQNDDDGAPAEPVTGHALLTTSAAGVFGQLHTSEGLFMVTTDAAGSWMIRLDDPRIDLGGQCALDHHDGNGYGEWLNDPMDGMDPSLLFGQAKTAARQANPSMQTMATESGDTIHQIDVLFLYDADMQARYPDDLINARLAHYVNLTNQALANTEIDNIVVRKVGAEFTAYEARPKRGFPANRLLFEAINDLLEAVNPSFDDDIEPGLDNLQDKRQQYGADIIALMVTADIETWGACGVAARPNLAEPNPSRGVQIVTDGTTNWSVCLDEVFAHELGHNLDMAHQAERDGCEPGGNPNCTTSPGDFNFAMVKPGHFNTIMSSFGSADLNRYLRLTAFSNPDMTCAGVPCGRPGIDDGSVDWQDSFGANAKRLFQKSAPIIAAYAEAVDDEVLTPLAKAFPDSDGDGVFDWDDPFPYGEPILPVARAYRAPRPEEVEGRGDFELLVSSTDDRIYAWRLGDDTGAEAMGAVIEAEPPPFPDLRLALTEFSSMAVRADGLLFALSGGAVRSYSRFDGREVDRYRGPNETREGRQSLPDGFPRSLALINGDENEPARLLVLGDSLFSGRKVLINAEDVSGTDVVRSENNVVNWRDVVASDNGLVIGALHAGTPAGRSATVQHYTRSGTELTRVNGWPFGGEVVSPRAVQIRVPEGDVPTFYVADDAQQHIYRRRADPTSGVEVELFLDLTEHGVTHLRDLKIGPDGDFYVLDQGQQAILRFDPKGDLVETVVGPDAPELAFAERMVFAPALLDNELFIDRFEGTASTD